MTSCRSCGAQDLAPIVSLGEMALANRYVLPSQLAEDEPKYPLDLVRCRTCQLVQLTCVVPPEILFRDYLYLSSYSPTMLRHAEALVLRTIRERHLGPESLVTEVASNDGYLLQYYVQAGIPVLGIEPAHNVAAIARDRGVRTVDEFFGATLAAQLRSEGNHADVIHANNVLAHVADLNGFVEGFRILLAPDGVIVSESPDLGELLKHVELDTIYHEHLYYYSLTALVNLFTRHGLVIEDIEALPIHGGSLRIFARHHSVAQPTARVAARLAEEQQWGVARNEPYAAFAAGVTRVTREVTALVRKLRAEGKRIAAYGAAAKGTVLLNACDLGAGDLEFVCDKNPLKRGRLMPGMHVPIVDPDQLATSGVDYCLLLAWNFASEIRREQTAFTARGGKFIIPIPTVEVV